MENIAEIRRKVMGVYDSGVRVNSVNLYKKDNNMYMIKESLLTVDDLDYDTARELFYANFVDIISELFTYPGDIERYNVNDTLKGFKIGMQDDSAMNITYVLIKDRELPELKEAIDKTLQIKENYEYEDNKVHEISNGLGYYIDAELFANFVKTE